MGYPISFLVSLCFGLCLPFASNANYLDASGILRNEDGKIATGFSASTAHSACRAFGKRLLTARDYANYAIARGAAGIIECKDSDQHYIHGYTFVDATHVENFHDSPTDCFHFNHSGYKNIESEWKGLSFVSADSDHAFSEIPPWIFNADEGYLALGSYWAKVNYAVQCK